MFDTANNAYNVDKKIDYSTVRSMVIRSLEKIVREELNRHSSQRRVKVIIPQVPTKFLWFGTSHLCISSGSHDYTPLNERYVVHSYCYHYY
jgi:hypothetical protein